jgi:hypothetical protein
LRQERAAEELLRLVARRGDEPVDQHVIDRAVDAEMGARLLARDGLGGGRRRDGEPGMEDVAEHSLVLGRLGRTAFACDHVVAQPATTPESIARQPTLSRTVGAIDNVRHVASIRGRAQSGFGINSGQWTRRVGSSGTYQHRTTRAVHRHQLDCRDRSQLLYHAHVCIAQTSTQTRRGKPKQLDSSISVPPEIGRRHRVGSVSSSYPRTAEPG